MQWRSHNPWFRRRRLYAAAIWLLFAAQLNLIFAAEFHRHGYPYIRTDTHAVVSAASRSAPPPPNSDGSTCLVCQIVRQSAARPASAAYAPRPSNRVFYHFLLTYSWFSNRASAIVPARAPPSITSL